MSSKESQEYAKSCEKNLKSITKMREHKFPPRTTETRTHSDVDYARVLYCTYFRRLQGKMQLFIPRTLNRPRNRLTHSLEVAQIAYSLARILDLEDTRTVQTCSLAHDIGNAPFGHAGEEALKSCCPKLKFEGNAQTFRVLTHLAEKHPDFNGLNLTYRTLLGIVKYPPGQDQGKQLYNECYNKVKKWSREHGIKLKTIDCEIMDLADEIAYAAHDLEDSLRLKFFTIDELLYKFQLSSQKTAEEVKKAENKLSAKETTEDAEEARKKLLNAKKDAEEAKKAEDKLSKLVEKAEGKAKKANTYESSEEYSILFKKELNSLLINSLVNDIDLVEDKLGYKTFKKLAQNLKKFTFDGVQRDPEIMEYELRGRQIIKGLYNIYMDENYNKDLKLLPAEFREENTERTIIDYIAGMTDEFATKEYIKYYGETSLVEQ